MVNSNIILVGDGKGQILTEDFVRNMRDYLRDNYKGAYEFDTERFIKACYKKVE